MARPTAEVDEKSRTRQFMLAQLAVGLSNGCAEHIEGTGLYCACLVFGLGEEHQLYVSMAGNDVPKEFLIEVLELALEQLQPPRKLADA